MHLELGLRVGLGLALARVRVRVHESLRISLTTERFLVGSLRPGYGLGLGLAVA